MIEYVLFVPAPLDRKGKPAFINANQRLHWAPKAEMTRNWRTMAKLAAQNSGLPKGLDRVHIVAYVNKANKRPYDAHNLYPTAKAAIDGLVDHGLIVDDLNEHLEGPDLRQGDVHEQAGITLIIKELE